MNDNSDEQFQFELQEGQNFGDFFNDDPKLEEIARVTSLKLKSIDETRLNQIVDNRVNSIYESGLLEAKLKKNFNQDGRNLSKQEQTKLDDICKNFWTYLIIRGDGNCFYRSFIISYILKAQFAESCQYLYQLIKMIYELNEISYIHEQKKEEDLNEDLLKFSSHQLSSSNTLSDAVEEENILSSGKKDKPFQKQTNDNQQTETTEPIIEQFRNIDQTNESDQMKTIVLSFLIQILVNKIQYKNFQFEAFIEYYNKNPQLDLSLIIICKNLLLVEYENMKQDNHSKHFIDDCMVNEIKNMLLIYGQSASDIVFSLAARAFKCKLQVQNIYFLDETTLIDKLLTFYQNDINENNNMNQDQDLQMQISVWYSGGHYDILFDEIISEQILSLCGDENLIFHKQQNEKSTQNYQPDEFKENQLERKNSYIYSSQSLKLNLDSDFIFENKQEDSMQQQEQQQQFDNINQLEKGFYDQKSYDQINQNLDLSFQNEDKYQEINQLIKQQICFCCNANKDVVLCLQNDSNDNLICKDCFNHQYNLYRLERPTHALLSESQIVACFYQLIQQNILIQKCISCYQVLEKYDEFQKLDFKLIKQLKEKQTLSQSEQQQKSNEQNLLQQQEQNNINQMPQPLEQQDNNLNNCMEIQYYPAQEYQLDDYNSTIQYAETGLFCLNCLRDHIFNSSQYLQQKDYQIYLQYLQLEVDFCFKASLNEYFITLIKDEYLMKNQSLNNDVSICQICQNKLTHIYLQENVATSMNTQDIYICIQCLNAPSEQQQNTSQQNKNNNQFFQTQYFLQNLSIQQYQHQCLICSQLNESQSDQSIIQSNFFGFIFQDKYLCICFNCLQYQILVNQQNIQIQVKDSLIPVKIFLGQQQIYNLLKFIQQSCIGCQKENNTQNNQISLLNTTNYCYLYQFMYQCEECQKINSNQYQQQELQEKQYMFDEDPQNSLPINRKRSGFDYEEQYKICISCNEKFMSIDDETVCYQCSNQESYF